MKITKIKSELLKYTDFFGGNIICEAEVQSAKTIEDLVKCLDKHEAFLEDQLADAKSHLNNLRNRIGLNSF